MTGSTDEKPLNSFPPDVMSTCTLSRPSSLSRRSSHLRIGEDSHVADGFLRDTRRFRFERNGGVERLADDRISERVYIDECRANLCPLDNSFLLAGFVQPPQFRDGAVALHQRLVARLLCVARGFGSPFADEQIPIGLDRLRRYRIP